MKRIAIFATKLSSALLKLIHRGGSLPGSIGLKLCPTILHQLTFDGPIIVVTGTNGKTSTSNMIAGLFEHAGKHVISNRKGDNLKEGITTAILTRASLGGHVHQDALILEVDELNIPYIMKHLPVCALVVTNFFRDQLDRAREMEQLIQKIEQAIHSFSGTLVLNGNDPNVIRLYDAAPAAKALYFGMERCESSSDVTNEASEGKFCPRCGNRLAYTYYQYSHIGEFHCTGCDFQTPHIDICGVVESIPAHTFTFQTHLFEVQQGGLYTMYNAMAVLAVAQLFQLPSEAAQQAFQHVKIPDGRNETFMYQNRKCTLNLVKNPTGANEVMKVIEEDTSDKTILLVLNDNAQDGTDVSWIYDTFFDKLVHASTTHIICSGTRAYDIALRMKYAGYAKPIELHESLNDAVNALLRADNTMYAIATYTALQPVRNLLRREIA